ncbi:MAG TPA: pyridoxal phosphate-dependent aminotransferase [Vicinamibacterales bacterium]|nr:pyridoxal phosphate-dependent aminotransferase [Vicinamibacterales bacterium]
MGRRLDSVPFSGIIRIRDMMFGLRDPYRLDQGDVSFDVPPSVKEAMARAIAENRTHYVQTTGVPRLLELLAAKLQAKNRIPVGSPDEVMVTTGGIHAIYIAAVALLEPGDEVIVPDPEWPPCVGNILAAEGRPVPCPLREDLGWRWDLDELASLVTPRTRAIYVNSPNNPTGGVLTRADLESIAELARRRDLWVISDEAYEDILFDGAEHVSIASLGDMYERTIPVYTFSKSYAMTGLRLGYTAVRDAAVRERMKKVLSFTASNVSSIVQYGGIGALEGDQSCVEAYRRELEARRDLFYAGIGEAGGGVFRGEPPKGAFYAFLGIDPAWTPPEGIRRDDSLSWTMAEYLITRGRIGCVPGVDFGRHGEGFVRFCFARERRELTGALEAMRALFPARAVRP